jgi:hypothetical protein
VFSDEESSDSEDELESEAAAKPLSDMDKPVVFDPDLFLSTMMNTFGISMEELTGTSEGVEEAKNEEMNRDDPSDSLPLSLQEYFDAMDHELMQTKLGASQETLIGKADTKEEMDINFAKNILESFTAQDGLSGPASNIMQSLGYGLPRPDSLD